MIDAGTATTRYLYDNEDILLELNGANSIIARYTHGPGIDEPLIIEKNAQFFYYHADGLGSITEITNQSGTLVQRYMYSSFGKIESQLDPSFVQPYTFTARELNSETGLYFYRTRYYEAATGRFLQEDPLGMVSGDLNLYGYVGARPVTLTDPTGECPWCLAYAVNILGRAGVGAIVGGGLNLGIQLFQNDGRLECVDWEEVLLSAAVNGLVSAGLGAYFGRPFWQYYPHGNPGYATNWLTRGPGFKPPFAPGEAARDALQLNPGTNPGTAVRPVVEPFYRPTVGPRPSIQIPQFGNGGGAEYFRGWRFPPPPTP